MATTPRGAPYPDTTDQPHGPDQIRLLAEWVDARPGVSPLTTAQRDALTGADLWTGRVIFNLTTVRAEKWNGTSWDLDVSPDYLTVGRHDLEARHAVGTVVPRSAPVASNPGDTVATGTTNKAADAGHRHAREAKPLAPSGFVSTAETRSNAVYGRTATTGPTATVTVGQSGIVIVGFSATLLAAADAGAVAYAAPSATVGGASVLDASDTSGIYSAVKGDVRLGSTHPVTGLTPGATLSAELLYRSSVGASTFANRRLYLHTM